MSRAETHYEAMIRGRGRFLSPEEAAREEEKNAKWCRSRRLGPAGHWKRVDQVCTYFQNFAGPESNARIAGERKRTMAEFPVLLVSYGFGARWKKKPPMGFDYGYHDAAYAPISLESRRRRWRYRNGD